MTIHQYNKGQLVEYNGPNTKYDNTVATVLEKVNETKYQIKFKTTGETDIVEKSELSEL